MNKIWFYLREIFIKQPVDGFKEIVDGISEFFNKPKNLVFISFLSTFSLILAGALSDKKLDSIIYFVFATSLMIVLVWKQVVGGELEHKWKIELDKELKDIEQKR